MIQEVQGQLGGIQEDVLEIKTDIKEIKAIALEILEDVKFIKRVDVCEDGSYYITKRPGAIFITQYETAAAAVPAAEPVEA